MADNIIIGSPYDDILIGTDQADAMAGGTGRDLLDGGPGGDTYLFARGDGQDTVLAGPSSPDGSEADTLQLGQGITMADIELSPQGSDLLLSVRNTNDSVRIVGYFNMPLGEALRIRFADGGQWDGLAVAGKLSMGDDFLGGTASPDVLMGGAGRDTLLGGEGNDTLYGDAGADLLDGGQGADTCLFGRDDGQDTLVAYGQDGQGDRLLLAADISVSDVDVLVEGGDLLLCLRDTRDSVRLSGYFNQGMLDRPVVVFASGAAWDGAVIEQKVFGWNVQAWGTAGDDNLEGGRGDDQLIGKEGDDTLYGDAGRDLLDGGEGADTYLFGRGDAQDTVIVGWPSAMGQADRLQLGAGIDMSNLSVRAEGGDLLLRVAGSSDSVRLAGYFNVPGADRALIAFADGSRWDGLSIDRKLQAADDLLYGLPADDMLDGGAGNDQLLGQDGCDTLYGDAGQDFLDGGLGVDTYLFGIGDGQDTILAAPNGWPPAGPDRLRLGQGIDMADIDLSQQGPDLLLARKGSTDAVLLAGYFNAWPGERLLITFADGSAWDGQAVDRLLTPAGNPVSGPGWPISPVLVGGQGDDALVGTGADEHLYGDAGNDLLDGLRGADTFHFGRGDGRDTIVADSGDTMSGGDVLRLGSGITAADVRVQADGQDLLLLLTGSADQVRLAGYFNTPPAQSLLVRFADGLTWDGRGIWRKLYADNEVLSGMHGDDAFDGGAGDDTLIGHEGCDTLYGGSGQDLLDGGLDADTYLYGLGDGMDTIVVDSGYGMPAQQDTLRLGAGITMADWVVSAQGGDLLLQHQNAADAIRLAGYLNLPADERTRIQFADGFGWTSDDISRKLQPTADRLVGTTAADGLDGGLGDDTLQGFEGRDFLHGDQGQDVLDGGLGADTLAGGAGNDSYLVDDLGDLILESASGGDDLIWAAVDGVIMADNVERLNMASEGVVKASGNEAKNYIKGNSLDNVLWGYGGNDSLSGYDGADQFYGGTGSDTLVGGVGNDSYFFARGEGSDVILDYDAAPGNRDRLAMQGDIDYKQLWFSRSTNDLVVSVIGTNDKVRIGMWFLGAGYRVESIEAGGKTLSAVNVQSLVNAMATMAPPSLGQTTLSASYSQKLGPAMASAWGA